MLSNAQIHHYHTFGFVIMRGCYSPAEVARLRSELQAQMARETSHLPPSDQRRDFCCMLGEHNPTFRGLLEDPRFLQVAEQLHGEVLPVWCDGNRYGTSDTGWHPDLHGNITDALTHAGVKFIHYLEPLHAGNGALRVIPGSHQRPLHDQVAEHLRAHAPVQSELPSVACEVEPGDVVAFHHALYHAAFNVRQSRWMHTLAYYPMPKAAAITRQICEAIASQIPPTRAGFQWHGEIIPDSWIAEAVSNPARRLLVGRMLSTGVLRAISVNLSLAEEVLGVQEPSEAVLAPAAG